MQISTILSKSNLSVFSFFRESELNSISASHEQFPKFSSSEPRWPLETLVKHKKNRRALRRNKVKNNNRKIELKLVGVNAAGLSSKFQSFENMLNSINPGVFFIEETKMKRPGKIKQKAVKNTLFMN